MDFVEDVRVSQEGAETGFRAKINRPATIFNAREISRIRIAEFSAAKGDEAWILLLSRRLFRHLKNHNIKAAGTAACTQEELFNFRNEDFEWIDGQSTRGFGYL